MTILSAVYSDIKNMIKLLEKPKNAENSHQNPYRICFVCTGNTCRSPMAAAVVNARMQSRKTENEKAIYAFSCGLYANDGAPISSGALHALEHFEVKPLPDNDYRKHTAKTLSEKDIREADLIIGMTSSHLMELLMRFPEAAGKMTAMPHAISDPYGGSDSVYEKTLEEIISGIRELISGDIE